MKNNRTLLRIFAAIMLVCMLIPSLLSCSDPAGEESTSESTEASELSTNATETTASLVDKDGYLLDDLPELDYEHEKVDILCWNPSNREFEVTSEDLTGDIVDEALFKRNDNVASRLNIEIVYNKQKGDANALKDWVSYVEANIATSSHAFDVMAGYSLTIAENAVNGHLYNLLDESCKHINFEQPWWSDLLLEQATFGDNLYFASGDISRNTLEMMYVCYANTTLLNEYQLTNPQEYVSSGDWTFEKFFEMCDGVWRDDGDGVKDFEIDGGDTLGFVTSGVHTDPLFYCVGATICERDSEGVVIESPSFTSERLATALEQLQTLLGGQYGMYTAKVTHRDGFGQGRLLFMIDRAAVSHNALAEYSGVPYLILPCPKFDKDQENYVTTLGNTYTFYSIPADSEDPAMASAVIEAFASEGYRTVSPAVFEISLKTRYVKDAISAQMYDIIKENISYDVGRIFGKALIGQKTWRDALANGHNWASVAKAAAAALPEKLASLNAVLDPQK